MAAKEEDMVSIHWTRRFVNIHLTQKQEAWLLVVTETLLRHTNKQFNNLMNNLGRPNA